MSDIPFSFKWQRAVTGSKAPMDSGARLVALVLSLYMDNRGSCFPAIETIAERTGLHRRTVQRAISRLKESGYLLVFPVHRAPNRYQATLPHREHERVLVEVDRKVAEEMTDWTRVEIRFASAQGDGSLWSMGTRTTP